ncbi:hypothetical protein ILYODFUR_029762 [Ilyodon furcidens]|uniref:Uncharacterized protein n=1 Tax=Ilyodon furcidens TaxID=33524 RepID=A0ABV0UK56_9TELE
MQLLLLLRSGKTISLIMVLETQSGVRRTVYILKLKKAHCGTTFHVQLLSSGSVRNYCCSLLDKYLYVKVF